MIFRYGIDEDVEISKNFWKECFLDSEDEREFYFSTIYNKDNFLLGIDEEKVVASLHQNKFLINFEGNLVNSEYIVGVGVLPENRNRGYMKKIMRYMLTESYKKNIPFNYLMPINSSLYRKFGYEYISGVEDIEVRFEDIYHSLDKNITIYKYSDENRNDLKEIYNEKMKKFSSYVFRDDGYLKKWCGEIFNDGGDIYIFYRENIPCGYVVFYKEKDIKVRESFGIDRNSYENILGFLKSFKEYYGKITITTPENDSLIFLFQNQKRMFRVKKYIIMGRITNIYEMMKLIRIKEKFVISIKDEIIEENNGVFEVSDKKIEKTKKRAEVELEIATLTQLLFGYTDIDELLFLEKIKIKDTEVVEKLKRCFVKKRNYIYDFQ